MVIMSVFISILSGCGGGGGGVWNNPGIPAVSSTNPVNGATGVAITTDFSAIFSVAMAPETLISPSPSTSPATNFTVCSTGAVKAGSCVSPVAGVVTYLGNTATFTPDNNLSANTWYKSTITTGAKSQEGIAMAANFSWSFTTGTAGPAADTTAPTLISTGAFDGETGLPINRDSTATFSEPMASETLISPSPSTSPATNFTVCSAGVGALPAAACVSPVAGVVTYLGNTATFTPDSNLSADTWYTSNIKPVVTDPSGNALVPGLIPNTWSWKTGNTADNTAPTVTATNPANQAIDVPVNKTINATFSKAMKQATMITANFTVKETVSNNDVPGTVAYDVQNKIATFSPWARLTPATDYTVTVTNGAKDLAGNALAAGLVPNPWTFKTAAASVPVPQPLAINLGRAASFGIASQAGLTSTGVTVVNGNIALYPLAKCIDSTGNAGASQACLVKTYKSSTGMTVNGSIYWAGDPFDNGGTASSATRDLNIAWVEGKNKVDTKPTVAGGQLSSPIPYFPGVYHNANLGLAAGGIATLDAQNDPNAIFIFKVDSDFVDSGTLLLRSKIVLINGAQARNVWFVAGRDITIGSGTTWNGNILAGRTATILDGSTVNGRVLAGASGAGAITLTGAASPSRTTISVPQ